MSICEYILIYVLFVFNNIEFNVIVHILLDIIIVWKNETVLLRVTKLLFILIYY